MERRLPMNDFKNNNQPNNVYTYFGHAQSLYSQYIQLRTQLTMLDNNMKVLSIDFYKSPKHHKLHTVQNVWYRKYGLMQQMSQIKDNIVSYLTEATRLALSLIQSSIAMNNRLGAILNDNTIAFICSQVEEEKHQLLIKESYSQCCRERNINMQINDIETRARMMQISLPNFDRLKRIIRGY